MHIDDVMQRRDCFAQSGVAVVYDGNPGVWCLLEFNFHDDDGGGKHQEQKSNNGFTVSLYRVSEPDDKAQRLSGHRSFCCCGGFDVGCRAMLITTAKDN